MRYSLWLVVLFSLANPVVSIADWPAFLGGRSRAQPVNSLPIAWSASDGLKWKTPLKGIGQSSPVVVGDNVYLTAVDGPNKETNIVFCLALNTGEVRWKHEFENSLQVKNDNYTSRAAPTPVADRDGVYAFFESGDLVALTPTGMVRWERKLIQDYGRYEGRFGLGGSPAQIDDRLVILADNEGPSYILAIDKQNGKNIWKTDRTSRTSWSSPMILDVEGRPQVIVSSSGTVDGYDLESGVQLWSLQDLGGNTVASPVPFGQARFLVGASPGRGGENTDGARRTNMAVQVEKQGDSFQAKVLWRNEKVTSSFGSPMVYQGRAYYTNRAGVAFCLDAETGSSIYNARLADSNWATPVGVGDRVYFFGQKGETTVIRSADTFEELAVNRLWDAPANGGGPGGFNAETQYGIALAPSRVLIRTGSNLYCVGK